jgi:AraC-like DNA-binding protein
MSNIKYYLGDTDGNIIIKTCDNSIHSSKRHFHQEISIALVESGNSKVEVGPQTYDITERTFLIIPENSVHSCHPYNFDKWKFNMLYINRLWFDSVYNKAYKTKFSYIKLDSQQYDRISEFFNSIKENFFDIEKEAKLIELISMLKQDVNGCTNDLNIDKIERTKKFIDNNYLNDISLCDLEKVSDLNRYSVIRQFSEQYGLAPHQYITNARINFAKTLFKSGYSFADIAVQSGFYDQSHFTKCFKNYTGVTPKHYLQQI